MVSPMMTGRTRSVMVLVVSAAAAAALAGCSTGDAPKSWNELSTCLAGSAATADLTKRLDAVRRIQLNFDETKPGPTSWPARCAAPANSLFEAVASAREYALLKR